MEPGSEPSLLTRLLGSRSGGIRGFNQARPCTPQCCPDTMMDGLQKYLEKPEHSELLDISTLLISTLARLYQGKRYT